MNKTVSNILLALIASTAMACGSDDASAPTLGIDVFGYGPDFDGGVSFVPGLPNYADSQTVILTATQPLDGKVLSSADSVASSGKGRLPGVPYGENLRLEMSVLDGFGEVIASGATPIFDYDVDDESLTFRLQISEVDEVTPIGAVFGSTDGTRSFLPSRFDSRGYSEPPYLGRIGHGLATTSKGQILAIGGGDPIPGGATTTLPEYRSIYKDIQMFDPETSYFSNIAFNDAANQLLEGDQLFEAIVFPAVTSIGDDRYLVAGGFTTRAGELRPTNTIQIIDLNALPGEKVKRLVGADQNNTVLNKARGMASATYRPGDNTVVVAGGIGPAGADDILNTFEVIDLNTGTISGALNMREARVEHTAVLTPAGDVWLIGGRTTAGALKSTEVIDGDNSDVGEDLKQARFGHSTVVLNAGGGDLVMVVGGFTDLADATTQVYEVGSTGRGFQSGSSWTISNGRGRPTVAQLPNTNDIVVLGGRDTSGDVDQIERLEFKGLSEDPPFESRLAGTLSPARYQATATVASTGKVVLIGGIGDIGDTIAASDSGAMYNAHDPVGGTTTAPTTGGTEVQ